MTSSRLFFGQKLERGNKLILYFTNFEEEDLLWSPSNTFKVDLLYIR